MFVRSQIKPSEISRESLHRLRRKEYYRPFRYRHSVFSRTIRIRRGELGVLLFFQEGGIVQIVRLGALQASYQIEDAVPRGFIALSDDVEWVEYPKAQEATQVKEYLPCFPGALSPEARSQVSHWESYFTSDPLRPELKVAKKEEKARETQANPSGQSQRRKTPKRRRRARAFSRRTHSSKGRKSRQSLNELISAILLMLVLWIFRGKVKFDSPK